MPVHDTAMKSEYIYAKLYINKLQKICIFTNYRTHTDIPEFTCEICSKRFMYKTVLRRHMKLHSGEKQYR